MIKWAPRGIPSANNYCLRDAQVFRGQRLTVLEGAGVSGDPVREVVYWLDEDCQLIARHDPTENDTSVRGEFA